MWATEITGQVIYQRLPESQKAVVSFVTVGGLNIFLWDYHFHIISQYFSGSLLEITT